MFRAESFLGSELFDTDSPVVVGRGSRSGLVLSGEAVSRTHCRIQYDGTELLIEDLGSANGTYVNRVRVVGIVPVLATDAIHIGAYTLKLRALRSTRPRPPMSDDTGATTKVEAALFIETDGSKEASIDISSGFDQRLYDAAIQRATGREAISDPSKPMIHASGPNAASDAIRLDPSVEARLRDLDQLIASLDEKERVARKEPTRLRAVPQFKEDSESVRDIPALHDMPAMTTSEFARDLVSRLALDGKVVDEHPAAYTALPVPASSIITETAEPTRPDPPRPVIVPQRAESSSPPPMPRSVRRSLSMQPPPLPRLGTIPRAPMGRLGETEGSTSRLQDRSAMLEEPVLLKKRERSQAPKIPGRPGTRVEARLVTPTHMKVGVHPVKKAPAPVIQENFDDVWTSASRVIDKPARARRTQPPPPPPPGAAPRVPMQVIAPHPKSAVTERETKGSQTAPSPTSTYFESVEIVARARGAIVDVSKISREGEQYVLGHKTREGKIAPASAHPGLRMLRINPDRTVDLVFPKDIGGHLVRGKETVMFSELTEGRKYSCLRLEARDIVTLIIGEGQRAVHFHVRFIRGIRLR